MEKQNFFSAFVSISKAISSSLDLREVLDLIVSHAVDSLDLKAGTLSLWNKEKNRLELIAHRNLSQEFLEKGPVFVDKSIPDTIMLKRIVVVPNAWDYEHIQYPDACEREGIKSIVSVPIIFRENVIGVLRLYDSESRKFTNQEIEFITALSEQGAIAIENARSMQQVLERHKKEMEDHKKEVEEIWDWFDSTYNYPRILDG